MCFTVLDDLKHFINRIMEDQLLSADYGHLSFCTMQCNELVLTLQDGDSMFLWNVRMISLYYRCKNSGDHHLSNTWQENQKIYDVLHCWSFMKKTAVFTALKDKHTSSKKIFRSLQWCLKARKFQWTAENKWQKGNIYKQDLNLFI